MMLIAAGGIYVLMHLTLFVTVFRHVESFAAERVILRYHTFSAIGVVAVGSVISARDAHEIASAVGIVAIHGLYSLSFLELWSLAQGGYSLAILREISAQGDVPHDIDTAMRRLGAAKTELRVQTLTRLAFIRQAGDRLELTGLGRALSRIQYALLWMVNAPLSD